jgi:hypothetical protein
MIEEIKLLLGDAAASYTDAQISLAYKMSLAEIEDYCRREADAILEFTAERIAVIKLLRMGTEGLASQSFSGVSEGYIDGYPDDIKAILNRKRKLVVL